MRLIGVTIKRYKRFREASVNLDGNVIALVGPNQAGKTSLLQALRALSTSESFGRSETTRGEYPQAAPEICARYLLEDEDKRLIATVFGSDRTKWLLQQRWANGQFTYKFDPPLPVDLGPRQRVREAVTAAVADPPLLKVHGSAIRNVEQVLKSEDQLSQAEIGVIRTLAQALRQVPSNELESAELLRKALDELAEFESVTADKRAVALLAQRVPRFLLFGQVDRTLAESYELTEVINTRPIALDNVLALAGCNLREIYEVVMSDDQSAVQRMLRRLNRKFEKQFTEMWSQAPSMRIQFSVTGTILHVHIVHEEDEYASIAETSDGLRTFIALMAFVKRHSADRDVILLIDEAETHLHYDAQADLMRMFRKQKEARKIIYSTHSAGCLPQDLGTSVKSVVPDEDPNFSTVKNSIWTLGQGMGAVMLGMGATIFAFSPLRQAVVGEGPSEPVLLPTLLREVMELDDLEFQVVSGVAEVKDADVEDLDFEARRVVYIVDSDAGGRAHAAKLRDNCVNQERIFEIGLGEVDGLTLEDVLDAEVYREAVNEELRRSHHTNVQILEGQIPTLGRSEAVRTICRQRGVSAPKKVNVAARIVEMREERCLVSADYCEHMRKVFAELTHGLRVARCQV